MIVLSIITQMRSNMNYEEIVDFVKNQKGFHDIEYLKSILSIFNFKINPERVIVVAGTNGKGTTSATISTLLIESGENVGFFSSPHLKKINERIKFNNVDISDEDFCEAFAWVKAKVGTASMSPFEWLTFMAAYYFFEKKKVDYAVFEVGLGGTYDSTNIIPHKFCVITKIAFDHQHVLGNSLIDIAKNKLGIVSRNSIVFHTAFDLEIDELSKEYVNKYDVKFFKACDFSMEVEREPSHKYPQFFVKTRFGKFKMTLPGKRAAENTALALTAFDYIFGNANKYGHAIEKVNWPGRMQLIKYKGREVFLSGDHNPNGVQSLLEVLQYYHYTKIHFVIGICRTKDYTKMLKMFFDVPNAYIYLTETAEKVLLINEYDCESLAKAKYVTANQKEALDVAVTNASDDDLVIVTGSLYLIGKILSFFTNNS